MSAVPPTASETATRPLAALAWMTGCLLSFAVMTLSARQLYLRHDTFEILGWRSLIGLVIVLGFGLATGRLSRITTRHFPRHLVRNSAHFIGQALWFWALTQLAIAQVIALEFTSPLWVILLAPLILGEKLRAVQLLAAAIGFIGVLVVARPDFTALEPGLLAAAACAIFFALNILFAKGLTRLGEDVICIMFWQVTIQMVLGFGIALADGVTALPDASSLPWLLLVGVAGLSAHGCMTMALTMAPASFIGPVDFVRLPLIAILAAIFYHEPLTLGLVLGSALILGANWLSLRSAKNATPRR